MNALWNPLVTGFCINVNLAAIIFGSINVVIDIVLLVLPIPLVWQLKIQMKWRLQLIGIFLLGGLYADIPNFGAIWLTDRIVAFVLGVSTAQLLSATSLRQTQLVS